jgi:hypothetical protein
MTLRTGAWSGSMRGGGVHQGRPSFMVTARRRVAAWKATSAVTGGQREPLPGTRDATILPECQHALVVDHDWHDLRLAGDSQCVGG